MIMTEITETHNERAERLNGRLAMLLALWLPLALTPSPARLHPWYVVTELFALHYYTSYHILCSA